MNFLNKNKEVHANHPHRDRPAPHQSYAKHPFVRPTRVKKIHEFSQQRRRSSYEPSLIQELYKGPQQPLHPKTIILPILGIVNNVIFDVQVSLYIPNHVIVITTLPVLLPRCLADSIDGTGGTRLKSSHDFRDEHLTSSNALLLKIFKLMLCG